MVKPCVSVLMTAYNRELYIEEAMRSVLSSSFENLELIVVDDASTDKTFEIAKSVAVSDERVRVYCNEENLGQFPNRNKAAELARGDLIKFQDSDDLIYPYSLGVMVDAMLRFPEAGGGVQSVCIPWGCPFPYLMQPRDSLIRHFTGDHFLMIGPSGWILRRKAFDQIKGFDRSNYVGADTLFSLKLAGAFPVAVLPPALIWYREHEGQELRKGINSGEYANQQARWDRQMIQAAPLSCLDRGALLKYLDHSIARRFLGELLKGKVGNAIRLKNSGSMSLLKLLRYGPYPVRSPNFLKIQE